MTASPDYESVMSARFGIVRNVIETEHRPENAPIHVISAVTGEIAEIVTGGSPVVGSGASISHDAAFRSAIGEVLERYSAKWVPTDGGVLASYADLVEPAPHPAGFALFHADQYSEPGFPFDPFSESTVLYWVPAVELASGTPSWLPRQLVYLHHDSDQSERRISYSTSSGLACAADYDDAVLRALLEVIERDAAMLAWYVRLSPRGVDVSEDPVLSAIERTYFLVPGVRHVALDLSSVHGIPTILVLVEDEDPATGGVAFGSACALDARLAWLKAMTEAYHTRLWTLDLRRRRGGLVRRVQDVRTLEDHVGFYAVPEHARHLDFLRDPDVTVGIGQLPSWWSPTPSEAVAGLARSLQSSGVSSYALEITAPDVSEAGFHVARVVCPELCRLDVAYRTRYLGGDRLYSAARELGLSDRRLQPDDLNPYPHPFP